jgi:hypothetical protein
MTMMKQRLKDLRKTKDQRKIEDRRSFDTDEVYHHNRRGRADRRYNNILVKEVPLDGIDINIATWYLYNKTR